MKTNVKFTAAAAMLLAALSATGCGSGSAAYTEAAQPTAAVSESTETEGTDGSGIAAVMTIPENTETYAEEEAVSPEPLEEAETETAAEEEAPQADLADNGEEPKAGFIDESFAEGDIVIIGIGSNFLDCSVKYGNVKLLEDESTSGSLYFQGVTRGKDNIVISESTDSGVVFREYAVIINDDLSVDLYPSNDFSLYTAQ